MQGRVGGGLATNRRRLLLPAWTCTHAQPPPPTHTHIPCPPLPPEAPPHRAERRHDDGVGGCSGAQVGKAVPQRLPACQRRQQGKHPEGELVRAVAGALLGAAGKRGVAWGWGVLGRLRCGRNAPRQSWRAGVAGALLSAAAWANVGWRGGGGALGRFSCRGNASAGGWRAARRSKGRARGALGGGRAARAHAGRCRAGPDLRRRSASSSAFSFCLTSSSLAARSLRSATDISAGRKQASSRMGLRHSINGISALKSGISVLNNRKEFLGCAPLPCASLPLPLPSLPRTCVRRRQLLRLAAQRLPLLLLGARQRFLRRRRRGGRGTWGASQRVHQLLARGCVRPAHTAALMLSNTRSREAAAGWRPAGSKL